MRFQLDVLVETVSSASSFGVVARGASGPHAKPNHQPLRTVPRHSWPILYWEHGGKSFKKCKYEYQSGQRTSPRMCATLLDSGY